MTKNVKNKWEQLGCLFLSTTCIKRRNSLLKWTNRVDQMSWEPHETSTTCKNGGNMEAQGWNMHSRNKHGWNMHSRNKNEEEMQPCGKGNHNTCHVQQSHSYNSFKACIHASWLPKVCSCIAILVLRCLL